MIEVWFKVRKFIKEPDTLSQYSPIRGNQYFAPGRADAVFRMWASKGLSKIQDLFPANSSNMMSFGELRRKYNIDNKYFF